MKTKFVWILLFGVFTWALLPWTAGAAVEETWSASYTPWSGYWWPFSQGGLATGNDYRGKPSPLSKYDYVTSGTYYGPAWSYGSDVYYYPDKPAWTGLCFQWAVASVLEAEPTHKGNYRGTVFFVGDKKGFLVVKYHGAIYNTYPFDSPIDFHQLLETFIRDRQTPVIVDLGTNGEIWNHPVYAYTTQYTEVNDTRHYTTTISYIDDSVKPDYVGSVTLEETYSYYIRFDPDTGSVIDSWWDPDRSTDLPRKGYEPLGTLFENPTLDPDILEEIVHTDDDVYEENDLPANSFLLPNGEHFGIAADTDYYSLILEAGDRLDMGFEGASKLTFRFFGPSLEIIHTEKGDTSLVFTVYQAGEYRIGIIPDEPTDEREYTLYVRQGLTHQGVFPINPAGNWVNGMALLDWPETGSRRLVTLMTPDGLAHQGVNLSNPETPYAMGLLENSFGLESTGDGYILIDSDTALTGVHAVATAAGNLMGSTLQSPRDAAGALFFPYTPKVQGLDTRIGIFNVGNASETLVFEGYDSEGLFLRSDEVTLEPGQKYERDTFYIPTISSNTKSMQVSTHSGNDALLGYYQLFNPAYDQKGGAVVPLGPPSSSDIFVPQAASSDLWETRFHLMNAGLLDAAVTVTGYGEDGSVVAESLLELYAMQQASLSLSELFPETDPTSVASIRIHPPVGNALSGMVFYERKGMSQFAGMSLQAESRSTWTLPHIPGPEIWDTCIAVMNTGEFSSDTAFMLYDADGGILVSEERALVPNQRLAFNLADMFSLEKREKAAFLTVTSENDQPMVGIFFYATRDGVELMGGPLQ